MGAKHVVDLPEDLFLNEPSSRPPSRLSSWAGAKVDSETGEVTAKKRRRSCTMAASTFNRARVETQAMIDTQDWSACTNRHFVALYDLMHAKIYGVDSMLSASDRHRFFLLVSGFVKRHFGPNIGEAINYFRWLWQREIGREKWRNETGREGVRMTYARCCSNQAFADYCYAKTRKR